MYCIISRVQNENIFLGNFSFSEAEKSEKIFSIFLPFLYQMTKLLKLKTLQPNCRSCYTSHRKNYYTQKNLVRPGSRKSQPPIEIMILGFNLPKFRSMVEIWSFKKKISNVDWDWLSAGWSVWKKTQLLIENLDRWLRFFQFSNDSWE